MKKFLAIITSIIILSFCFVGCGQNNNTPIVLSEKPWSNSNHLEVVEYTIEKKPVSYNQNEETSFGEAEATGKFTYSLNEISGDVYKSPEYNMLNQKDVGNYYFKNNFAKESNNLVPTPGAYSFLVSQFNLTYKSGEYANKTDIMESAVLFKSSTLEPVFSYKIVKNASNEISYCAISDYISKKNYYSTNLQSQLDQMLETEIKGIYDNEMLPYIIRGRSSLTSGTSEALSLNNPVYSGVYNKSEERTINATINSSTYYVHGIDPDKNQFIKDYFDEKAIDYYDKETNVESLGATFSKGYALKSYAVSISLASANSGSTSVLYYSVPNFSCLGQVTSNVLLEMATYEYDIETGKIAYMFDYKISDYKTTTIEA